MDREVDPTKSSCWGTLQLLIFYISCLSVHISGKVVNFVKSENFLAIRIEDLARLDSTKDKESRSLLFHIVRKTVELSDETFSGFSASFIDTLTSMTRQLKKLHWTCYVGEKRMQWFNFLPRFNLVAIHAGLKHMETTCRLQLF